MKPRVKLKMGEAGRPRLGAATAFQGASMSHRDVAAWLPSRGSADADLIPELGPLVSRARDIHRNNGVAHAGVQTIVDNVVGTGFRLSARPDYLALGKSKEWAIEWAAKVQSFFHGWWWTTACDAADTFTGDQLTAQVMFSKINNGGSLTLPLWMPERADGYATKLQTVEIDRLSNPAGIGESTRLHGGIRFDDFGAPLSYYIRKRHPGDSFLDPSTLSMMEWVEIPRRTDFGRLRVIHDFDAERSGQSRGTPLLASILPQFKNIDRYTQAEIQAAVMNAMIFASITTPLSGDDIVDLFSKDPAAYLKARQEGAVRMQSGSLLALQPGDKLDPFLPQRPSTQFGAFTENIYRIIAVALDMPYELLLKDFSKTTYSSARAAMLEAWRSFSRRRDWLGTMWMDPIYGLFLEELVNDGRIDAPDFYSMRAAYQRCRWIGPGKGWVDPVKEAQAAGIRVTNNLSTLEDECAEQGKNWEEVLEQKAREQDKMRELGLEAKASSYPLDLSSDAPQGGPANPAEDQQDQQSGQGSDVPQDAPARTPSGNALDRRLARIEAAIASKPAAAPSVTIAEGAIRVENNLPAPIAVEPTMELANPGAADRGLVESEVLEYDEDGRPLRVRQSETYLTDAARNPKPAPGTVLRRVEKQVVARDSEGRILRTVELDIAP